ncbi:MAG: DUF3043 domain-containing protein, partial [Jiangellaceae bacterium]
MFRRRTPTETPTEAPTAPAADESIDATGRPSGKGRATPKRSEAEQARKQRVRPALTRREAAKRDRERTREERARTRSAMNTGDERYFLERDKGPVRKFLRDYVDSRRTIAEFFLPIILVILLTSLMRIPQVQLLSTVLWVVSMVLLVVDLTVLSFRVKKALRTRFPDETGRGHVFYAIMRSTQMRRLRLPKPTVKP